MRKLFSTLSSTLQEGVRGGLLFLALMATTCLLAEDFSVDGIYYNYLDGNNVEVTGHSYEDYSGAVTIPASVTYNGTTYSVTSIGNAAFRYCGSLSSVTIPNSVTSIGRYAFDECSSLTSITIPNSVTSIGYGAFYVCSSLTSIVIPNSVTSIGNSAFSGCSSLTSITIPNSVTSIGEEAFSSCSALTSIVVEAGNTTYDSRENCNAIIETTSNTLIVGCQKTIIPNSVTSIGNAAFRYCGSLSSVTIPNSVTSIGRYAFYYCRSLTSITIPNSVTSIRGHAFAYCSSLTSITIPNSVTSIGEWAFDGCSSLTSPVYNAHCFAYMPPSFEGAYTIPDGIKQIADWAFYYCSSLTAVTIPNSVTSIGNYAFDCCFSLTSITIPNSVTSIGNGAFRYCGSFASINIPNSVTSIGNSAFYNCQSLTSITIPESVTSIGSSAFQYCFSLTSVTIGNSVKSIGDNAFYECSSLSSVTIGNSVTSIGDAAFYECSSLTSITCEAETPPTVGQFAFYDISQSIPVYVPCGCVEAYKAANGWKDFTNIQEPSLAEYSIEVNVNDATMGTAKVDWNRACDTQISASPNIGYHFVRWEDGNTKNPRTLVLTQDTVLTAEFAQTFSGQCGDNLYWDYDKTNQTISITGSGDMYDYTADTQPWLLFKEQIVEVTTTNTVTSIGTSAFEGCVRLGKISLGTGLEDIAANAFAGCTRLYDIYTYATYPPFAEESSFANYNVYVYVPCEYQRGYTLDVVWGKFKFIECIDSEEATTDGNVTIVPGYNDVTITWPTEDNADNYAIVIEKDGEVFCTLTFNADGQLLNIAFAPARNGDNRPVQYAEQAVNGYRFTVTGLTEATQYAYSVTTKDAANQTIATYSGEFTTMGGDETAVDNITTNNANIQKILRNGQLLILRDSVEYNAMGQEL